MLGCEVRTSQTADTGHLLDGCRESTPGAERAGVNEVTLFRRFTNKATAWRSLLRSRTEVMARLLMGASPHSASHVAMRVWMTKLLPGSLVRGAPVG